MVEQFERERFKEEVRARNDLVALVNEILPLKRSGRTYKACCPFHSEKTPSFHVNPESQHYHCFGCHKGGDVFNWVMETEHVDFPEALRILAERQGMEVPRMGRRSKEEGQKKDAYAVLEQVRKFYYESFAGRGAEGARAYAESRGLLPARENFWIGYAPAGSPGPLVTFFRKKSLPIELGLQLGLLGRAHSGELFDRFRNRLMFPIADERSRCVGFGGRILPGFESEREPKYLNSRESPVFNKRRLLFGLAQFRKAKQGSDEALVIMEGYTDVIAAHLAGMCNAVATLGTSLTSDHARLIKRFSRQGAILLFDGDRAGRQAAERAYQGLATAMVPAKIALLEDGTDPADLVGEGGKEALQALCDQAKPAIEVFIHLLGMRFPLGTPEGKAAVVGACREVLREVPDPAHRQILLQEFSRRLYLDPQAFRVGTGRRHHPDQVRGMETQPQVPVPESPESKAWDHILASVLSSPESFLIFDESWAFHKYQKEPPEIQDPFARHVLGKLRESILETGDLPERELLLRDWMGPLTEDAQGQARVLKIERLARTLKDPRQAIQDSVRFLQERFLRREAALLRERIRQASQAGDSEGASALEQDFLRIWRLMSQKPKV
jgi:DNA primase